jgi:hypothetical protein
VKIRDGPAAVIGDKHRKKATVKNITGRRGCKNDPKVRRPALKRAMFPLDREHHRILSKKGTPRIGYEHGPGFFVSRATNNFTRFWRGK